MSGRGVGGATTEELASGPDSTGVGRGTIAELVSVPDGKGATGGVTAAVTSGAGAEDSAELVTRVSPDGTGTSTGRAVTSGIVDESVSLVGGKTSVEIGASVWAGGIASPEDVVAEAPPPRRPVATVARPT